MTTICNHGDSSIRVDLVILEDRNAAAELGKYAADAETAVNGFFGQGPLREYRNYFNARSLTG